MKTNKAVRKRFKISKKGKVRSTAALRRHLLADRPRKKKRQARGWREVDVSDRRRIQMMLPYGQ
ncbi:MAG: 50S ribosomal protein L35 [Candidatus Omnitrophota bacterium]